MADNPDNPQPSPRPTPKALDAEQCDYLKLLFDMFRGRVWDYVRRCVSDQDARAVIIQDTWTRVGSSDLFQSQRTPYYGFGLKADLSDPQSQEEIFKKIKGQAYWARLDYFKQDKVDVGGELQNARHVHFDTWHERGGDIAEEPTPDELTMATVAAKRLKSHGFKKLEIDVFILRTVGGLKYREIEEKVGVGKSTVDRIMHKIEAFADSIKDRNDD